MLSKIACPVAVAAGGWSQKQPPDPSIRPCIITPPFVHCLTHSIPCQQSTISGHDGRSSVDGGGLGGGSASRNTSPNTPATPPQVAGSSAGNDGMPSSEIAASGGAAGSWRLLQSAATPDGASTGGAAAAFPPAEENLRQNDLPWDKRLSTAGLVMAGGTVGKCPAWRPTMTTRRSRTLTLSTCRPKMLGRSECTTPWD